MEEIWKDVIGYERMYQISNLGNVKSLRRYNSRGNLVKEKILKPNTDSTKYSSVCFCKEGIKYKKMIHQLVAIAFLNHTPCGFKLVVNHKDFNRLNNHINNLEIVTARENANFKHITSTSQYVGVSWDKSKNRWVSNISINGKQKYLGIYKNEIDAHLAYQKELTVLIKQ